MVPTELEVVRVRAWSPRWTRRLRFGDLGIRSLTGLWRACRRASAGHEVRLRVHHHLSFLHCSSRSAGEKASPGFRSFSTIRTPGSERGDSRRAPARRRSRFQEPAVPRACAGARAHRGSRRGRAHRGLGGDIRRCSRPDSERSEDFRRRDSHRRRRKGLRLRRGRIPRAEASSTATDGKLHLSYVGTLLPLGRETLRAFLQALALLKDRDASTCTGGFRFISSAPAIRRIAGGSGARSSGSASDSVSPTSCRKYASRVDYLDALDVLSAPTRSFFSEAANGTTPRARFSRRSSRAARFSPFSTRRARWSRFFRRRRVGSSAARHL